MVTGDRNRPFTATGRVLLQGEMGDPNRGLDRVLVYAGRDEIDCSVQGQSGDRTRGIDLKGYLARIGMKSKDRFGLGIE